MGFIGFILITTVVLLALLAIPGLAMMKDTFHSEDRVYRTSCGVVTLSGYRVDRDNDIAGWASDYSSREEAEEAFRAACRDLDSVTEAIRTGAWVA